MTANNAHVNLGKSMTCRERCERVMDLQEPDRVPTYDLMHNDGAIEWYSGEKVTVADGLRQACVAISRSLDMTRSIHGPCEEAAWESPDGFSYRRLRWTQWIEKRPFRDVEGLKAWVKQNIRDRSAWRPDDAFTDAYFARFDQCQAWCGDTVILLAESGVGIEHAYHAATLELFCYLLDDDPGLVSEWLETIYQQEMRRVHAIADAKRSPVVLTYGDIAYKDKLIFSPDFLRREFFPRLKVLNDTWHNYGFKCLFHSDGNLMEVMEDIIAAGSDGLNPIEVVAGMDLAELKRLYGDRLFFAGGIDVSQLMAFGTPEQVKAACRDAIRAAGPGGGYFLGGTTELHNALPARNIAAMVDSAEEFGRYPLRL
jgi:hypothetical protein